MRILVSGSSGMVGTDLVLALKRAGHDVIRLVRQRLAFSEEPQIGWNPENGEVIAGDKQLLENLDAVFHLAGYNIASKLWSEDVKARIRDSRVVGTRKLAELLAGLANPPKTFISASATGFYGDQGATPLSEVGSMGKLFISRVCRDWETASAPASAKGIRVVHTRFGVILSPKGGALKSMKIPFSLGLAGNLGDGRQYMPWVALPDVVGALMHVLSHMEISGPVNVVAPEETTNAQFTDAMRKALIPAFLPMHYWTPPAPAIAIKAILGEMGESLFLASARVQPVRLLETGYVFKYPGLKSALADLA